MNKEKKLENYKVAFASNDGNQYNDEHFGDSDYYHIYEINEDSAIFIKTIENNTKNILEEVHADPNNAKGVSLMLKNEGVKILASSVFGPNIKRIKQQFVCIIFRNHTLLESIETIRANYLQINEEWNKGINRSHLIY